jgi:hypothetical protein
MLFHRLLTLALCLAAGASCAAEPRGASSNAAQNGPAPAAARESLFDPDLHLRTADVRVGMTGYGLSVFKGSAIERFEVEVLAILKNSEQIGTDVVLVGAKGANLEHTGPIAGMSGSPIYLHCDDGKDRLLGAFAFGWPGMKDPMAGVQPIEAMLELDARPRPDEPQARAPGNPQGFDILHSRILGKLLPDRPDSLAQLLALPPAPERQRGQLAPLAIPIATSGLSSEASRQLAQALGTAGITPLLAQDVKLAAGASDVDKIEPGSALIIPALAGDLNLVATGTCTTVIGDRVFGFGHSMFGDGRTSLPMAAGAVDAVIPTQEISFKLGSAGKVVGTLASDAVAGVAGTVGPVPPMVPVTIAVKRGPESQSFRFQAARHPMLTPMVLGAAATEAVGFRGTPDVQGATRWDVTLNYAGGRSLRLRDVAANSSMFMGDGFVGALVLPIQALQDNPFARVELESVDATVELLGADQAQIATLEAITLPRLRYRAGETVKANLAFRLHRGARIERAVELELPGDIEPGQYPLTASDSATALASAAELRPFEFHVQSIDDLFALVNTAQGYGSDAVYLRLDRPEQTRVAIGRHAMTDLPGSRALLLAESGRSDVTTFTTALHRKVDLPFVLTEGEAMTAVISIIEP